MRVKGEETEKSKKKKGGSAAEKMKMDKGR